MINFYRGMWKNRSSLLAPLTALTSKNMPFKWTDEHQLLPSSNTSWGKKQPLLAFPDFNAPFQIHTDACKAQIGAAMSQNGKPIAFYSQKMNDSQKRNMQQQRRKNYYQL
jgi:hypothetical protein